MKYPFLDEIAKYAKEHLPGEACGLIAGSEDENGRLITKVYYLTNTDHAEDHFTMDPKEQLAAIKDMRANGLKPLGNWHSHPSSPSRPSDEDIKLAYDPSASYMIMSLMAENTVINSFHIEGGKVDFVLNKADKRYYIQSALTVATQEKKDQELNSLLRIDDSFQKLVVVKDDILPWTDEHGISYINVQDFLLDAIDRL